MNETEMNFEDAFAALQRVVARLEEGTTTLDEALRLYEEGIKLATFCEQMLEQAELRVRELRTDDEWSSDETDSDMY